MRELDCTVGDAQTKRLRPERDTPRIGIHAIAAVLPKTKIEKGSKTTELSITFQCQLVQLPLILPLLVATQNM